jgi:ABC-type glycerol-3-phosphate transport system permease component
LEKYLLTITASATFYVLIPLSCALCAAYILSSKRFFGELAWKIVCFGLSIVLIVPTSVYVSNVIEETYNTSISTTIEDAKRVTEEIQTDDSTNNTEESYGISGLFSKVTEGISKATMKTVDKFKRVLNNMIEALAVMLVTSCLIPILVIVFFSWLVKLIFGINIPLPSHDSITKAKPMAHQKQDN